MNTVIVSGRSAPVQHTLNNGSSTFDATGFAAAIDIEDKDGATVALAVSWADAEVSKIQINDPSSLTIEASPYTYRWRITDGNGDVVYYPGNQWEPSTIVVVPVRP